MLYSLLRLIASTSLRWFYRDVAVIGLDRIPTDRPILLAANHPNALVDALVIGLMTPRRVLLTAKATLFDTAAGPVLRAVGVVPLGRAKDEKARAKDGTQSSLDPARNTESFRALLDALEESGTVLIFPEGITHDEPALAPLKTGLARIALQARDERGLADLRIVPVGLTFERKEIPRSRVLVEFGEPITVGAEYAATGTGITALTARVDAGLRDVTLNFPSGDDAARVLGASRFLSGLLDRVRPIGNARTPLVDIVGLARRLETIRKLLPALPLAQRARADAFVGRLDALSATTQRLGIPPNELAIPLGVGAGAWYALRETAIALVSVPIALWGRINHWLPLRIARLVAVRSMTSRVDPAMYTIVTGIGLVLVFYAIQAATVGALAGWKWMLAYLVSLPISASWDFRYRDRAREAWHRMRTYLRFRRDPALRERLLTEAAWLRAEAEALDDVMHSVASEHA